MRRWPLALPFYTWIDNARQQRYLRAKAEQAVLLYAREPPHPLQRTCSQR
jgi:hypothetical protein